MSDTSSFSGRFSQASPRQRWLVLVGIVLLIAALAYGAYWLLYARFFESTDDAYVTGDTAQINSRTAGTILAIRANNTQAVRQGQLLVELDPLPAQVAMQAAEADLANTARNVRMLFAKADEQRAQLVQAQAVLAQRQSDYKRRAAAVGDGAVSAEDLSDARHVLDQAAAAATAAQNALNQTLAQIQGTSVATNPQVLAAEARLRVDEGHAVAAGAVVAIGHGSLVGAAEGAVEAYINAVADVMGRIEAHGPALPRQVA